MNAQITSYHSCALLPDESSWRFDELARADPARARALEVAGTRDALVEALRNALTQAIDLGDLRVGRNHRGIESVDCRAVMQFAVGADLFDWFFNARTGYRAHFRAHYACGLGFNSRVIEGLRGILDARLPILVAGRELVEVDGALQDCGAAQIPKRFLMDSLVPDLSKVWCCTDRIELDGRITTLLYGVGGEPRILLDKSKSWVALYRSTELAWLDLKGAFVGKHSCYQLKDPVLRAKTLQTDGAA